MLDHPEPIFYISVGVCSFTLVNQTVEKVRDNCLENNQKLMDKNRNVQCYCRYTAQHDISLLKSEPLQKPVSNFE